MGTRVAWLLSSVVGFATATAVESLAAAPDFAREVRPILEAKCFSCHGQKEQKAGVAFHTHYHAHRPADSGEPVMVPGQPEESLLYKLLVTADEEKRMPKDKKPLTSAQVQVIKEWISQGAPWPDDGWRPPAHWAYVKPVAAGLPDKGSHPVDAFINARLKKEGLTPNPAAQPEILVRRLFLDVIGLPPTIAEVDAYAANPTEEAYAKLVDSLLARPQFGEKWARPWLDLARYADSDGYQRDGFRQVWPYRDWVVKALNDDMPFDQFTIEQLAGDLLPQATPQQLVATGFHRNATLNLEAGTDPEEDRVKQLVDRVNTTGTVWLGASLGCAQCHNHKYDPITSKEYYQVLAFFNNTPVESQQAPKGARMSYIGPDFVMGSSPEAVALAKAAQKDLALSMKRYEEAVQDKWGELEEDTARVAKLKPGQRDLLQTPAQDRDFDVCSRVHRSLFKGDTRLDKLQDVVQRGRKKVAEVGVTRTAVMRDEAMRETRIMQRGDFLMPGAKVAPATPAALHAFQKDAPSNRLGFAQWLVSEENPLVGRVAVNRWWAELFGQPIVSTMEDFGLQGDKPTHPELLDWLAVTFVETDGWSFKKTLRRILLSETYRRASAARPELLERDPLNKLFARNGGIRLEAEAIRDQGLAVSGLLSPKMGGPPVKPVQPPGVWRVTGEVDNNYTTSKGEDAHRRGLYTIWRRHAHYPSFATFDAPNRGACTVQRTRSNTPLQALTLMNDPAYVEMTHALAKRLSVHPGKDLRESLAFGFRTVLARPPSSSELDSLVSVYEEGRGSLNDAGAAWFDVASVLMNLHETITKP
ncbi:cytochrome c [Roseimicrobium gellanilyticum]|uniref:Cytochrome c n=1 Tax=Roseimicrobium gellanilyticum TaxID=748857 RepID=A0A366HHY2_9BACT|nr:PSD1 and planctomycete cytochrome C domain-containing protein [Roseimicrobium gellanilyticum]RBP41526.1 cytochrome c [Roseimicrobium gellanilyticum]